MPVCGSGTRAGRIDFERWRDEYKRMKFLVERKSLPPNDFQKIEAAFNAEERTRWLWRARARKIATAAAQHKRHTPRLPKNKSGWATRDWSHRSPKRIHAQGRLGQTVAAGMPVFSIVELNPVKVRVGVPEAEIAKVRRGAEAEITVPSLDGRASKEEWPLSASPANPLHALIR
jgi:hypothetical protein